MASDAAMNESEVQAVVPPPSKLKSLIAGGVGGTCLVLVGHPLDTIKVRIQTMTYAPGQTPPYTGLFDCAKKIATREGLRAFYKGVAAPLVGVTPMYALCFLGYSIGQDLFCDEDAIEKLKLPQIAAAGAFCSVFTTPLLAPGERVKCVLQSQGPGQAKYNGTMDTFKKLYAEGGIASVNRGFIGTLARDAVASAMYFATYEYLKSKFTEPGQSGPGPVGTFIAGGFAGMLNWAAALPLDTLKTRLQVAPEGKYGGIRHVFMDILRKESPLVLYRGFVPVMARAFPANAACFLGYETALRVMDHFGMK